MVALDVNHGFEPYYRRELEAHYAQATREQRRRGKRWYPTAREWASDLAERTGYTLEQAVAVMAVTSRAAQLVQNVHYTERALESRGTAKVGRFPNQDTPKVRAILADPELARDYVSGPKVGAFHRAILGDDALVLDRWAIYAAARSDDRDGNHGLTIGAREALVNAYRNAARAARTKVRDYQAIVWLQTRESTPVLKRGKYVVPRYVDITTAA